MVFPIGAVCTRRKERKESDGPELWICFIDTHRHYDLRRRLFIDYKLVYDRILMYFFSLFFYMKTITNYPCCFVPFRVQLLFFLSFFRLCWWLGVQVVGGRQVHDEFFFFLFSPTLLLFGGKEDAERRILDGEDVEETTIWEGEGVTVFVRIGTETIIPLFPHGL